MDGHQLKKTNPATPTGAWLAVAELAVQKLFKTTEKSMLCNLAPLRGIGVPYPDQSRIT